MHHYGWHGVVQEHVVDSLGEQAWSVPLNKSLFKKSNSSMCTEPFPKQLHDLNKAPPLKHIEAETKWPPIRRRPFEIHFFEWKCKNKNFD